MRQSLLKAALRDNALLTRLGNISVQLVNEALVGLHRSPFKAELFAHTGRFYNYRSRHLLLPMRESIALLKPPMLLS